MHRKGAIKMLNLKTKSIFAMSLALVLCFVCLVSCGQKAPSSSTNVSTGGVLTLKVNPEFDINFDEKGNVVTVTAVNDDAKKIMTDDESYVGKTCEEIVTDLVKKIGDAGYFAKDKNNQVVIEIEEGSKVPNDKFLTNVIESARSVISENKWEVPVDVNGESSYGMTNYQDTDYGTGNDGDTNYADDKDDSKKTESSSDKSNTSNKENTTTNSGNSINKSNTTTSGGNKQTTSPSTSGDSNYDDTDYGPNNDGVTDYNDTDYGPNNDGVTDYNDTDYGPNNDGVTDYNDTDYGPNNDGVTDYNDTDYGPNNDGVTDVGQGDSGTGSGDSGIDDSGQSDYDDDDDD